MSALWRRTFAPAICPPLLFLTVVAVAVSRDSEKDNDGMAFVPFCRELGGTQDPLTVLVEMDAVDEFRMLQTQIESARSATVSLAQENTGWQPRLQELQGAIRAVRDGGEIEAAETELDSLRVQKRDRETRYDRDTLRRTLRAAAEQASQRCSEMQAQPWVDGWANPAFANEFLQEKMRQIKRERLGEKLRTAAQ